MLTTIGSCRLSIVLGEDSEILLRQVLCKLDHAMVSHLSIDLR